MKNEIDGGTKSRGLKREALERPECLTSLVVLAALAAGCEKMSLNTNFSNIFLHIHKGSKFAQRFIRGIFQSMI